MSDYIFFEEIEEQSKSLIKQEVDGFIRDKTFNISDCDFLINKLTETLLQKLKQNSDNFKYILSIVLLNSSEKGVAQNIVANFDTETDGIISMSFKYPKISCIVNLFVLSI